MKLKTYKIVIHFIFTIFVCFFSWQVDAITLDRDIYPLDGTGSVPILAIQPVTDGMLFLYSMADNSLLMSFQSYAEGDDFNYSRFTPGRYSIVELSPGVGDEWVCNNPGEELDYESCKNLSGFVNEFPFTIKYGQYEYGGGSDEEAPTGGSLSIYPPQAEIKSPNSGGIFSSVIPIIYRAFDYNDLYGGESKNKYGLAENSVSLFYIDKFTREYELDYNDSSKMLIGHNLKNEDTYLWKANSLIEKQFYQIVLRVVDKAGYIFQTVSDLFSVDMTDPTFEVQANPKIVKNEEVTITINSSENLSELPSVYVIQRDSDPVKVSVSGSGSLYKAIYKPVDGHDGTAIIKVKGKDNAGNEGDVVYSGGSFNVGINPPIKPIITSHENNQKVENGSINISGSTREDTKVVATVNGKDLYYASPDEKGNFILKNINLNKKTANGKNVISISSVDPAGSTSDDVVLNILFNMPPNISILNPIEKSLLTGMSTIAVNSQDENGDVVRFKYEITKKSDNNWQLIEEVPSTKINFNTTKFDDGSYFLRVIADDGVSRVVSNPVNISIKNETSFFIRFYDGLRTFTKNKNVTVRGIVFADKNTRPSPIIKSLYYSMNGGVDWIKVRALDGTFDSSEERFSADISGLKDGLNHVMWQSRDSRGIKVNSEQPIIVDNIPPMIPEILSPKDGVLLTKDDNTFTKNNSFTFNMEGTSEPRSTVHVDIDNKGYNTTTSFDGFFKFNDIPLSKNGKYKIRISATDEALNKSQTHEQILTYDNPPHLVFTAPRLGKGLGNNTTVSWIMNDPDGDILVNKVLSYRKIGSPFIVLSKDFKGNTFKWNTSGLSGNDFEIKLEANDGLVSSSEVIPFSVDHNIPELLSLNIAKNTIGSDGVLEVNGDAFDGESGVEFVEYSIVSVDQINTKVDPIWYKGILKNKSIQNKVSFSINKKMLLSDGEYRISVHAVDSAGNISNNKYGNFILDTTGPRVGSFEFYNSGTRLIPEGDSLNVLSKEKIQINLSLEKDTRSAHFAVDGLEYPLVRNIHNGLWECELYFESPGIKNVYINAVDILGNSIKDQLFLNLNVKSKSRVLYLGEDGREESVSGATIDVYYSESSGSILSIFKSKKYTTVKSNESGEFVLYLPSGSWDLNVKVDGFNSAEINKIKKGSGSFFADNIVLNKKNNNHNWWSKLINVLKLN